MPAIRSLIVLIARRGTGISENRRRLYAVGLGIMSPGGPYELKIEGNGNVRRFFSAFPKDAAEDTPAIRRKAPRNVSLIFIKLFSKGSCGDSRPRLSVEQSSTRFHVARAPSPANSVPKR